MCVWCACVCARTVCECVYACVYVVVVVVVAAAVDHRVAKKGNKAGNGGVVGADKQEHTHSALVFDAIFDVCKESVHSCDKPRVPVHLQSAHASPFATHASPWAAHASPWHSQAGLVAIQFSFQRSWSDRFFCIILKRFCECFLAECFFCIILRLVVAFVRLERLQHLEW